MTFLLSLDSPDANILCSKLAKQQTLSPGGSSCRFSKALESLSTSKELDLDVKSERQQEDPVGKEAFGLHFSSLLALRFPIRGRARKACGSR